MREWGRDPIPNTGLLLVTTFETAVYSGMLPGTLAGWYQPREMTIDLRRLTDACGVRLIVDRVVGLTTRPRRIELKSGTALEFDIASVGLGSVPSCRHLEEGHSQILSIKPLQTFLDRLRRRLDQWPAGQSASDLHPPVVAIVGAGAAGVEVAFCLDVLLRREHPDARIVLIDARNEILPGYSSGAVRKAHRELKRRGIGVRLGRAIRDISEKNGVVLLRDRETDLPVQLVIGTTGAAAPPVLENFQLSKAEDGFLAVRSTLQTVDGEPVFAVGDAASLVDHPIPKAGVHAVREAPILWKNLRNLCAGHPLVEYKPQRAFLSLLATGDGRAILNYRRFSSHSRWAWKLKNWIDGRFVRQYQIG